MNEIIRFEHKEFGGIRALKIEENPWFVGIDVAGALGYAEPKKAVYDHCRHAKLLKGTAAVPLTKSPFGIFVIPESDVYRLIFRSKLPSAERFQDWVCEDVLPSIRKHGHYDHGTFETDQNKKSQHVNLAVFQLCKMVSPKIRARLALRTIAYYTDIDVDDLVEEQEAIESNIKGEKIPTIQKFLSENCIFGDDLKVNATALYSAFLSWHGSGEFSKISQKEFGAVMTGIYKKKKHGGLYSYYGLSLNQG